MSTVIPNGGGDDVTTGDLGAWDAVSTIPGGDQTSEESDITSDIEARVGRIAAGWTDSGGPGGFQQDVALEVLQRAAALQGEINLSVRQWAKQGRERALSEMLGPLVKALVERDRLILELRERLNASPY
jgi:hypothetical protein